MVQHYLLRKQKSPLMKNVQEKLKCLTDLRTCQMFQMFSEMFEKQYMIKT